jgi:hypothetical protein
MARALYTTEGAHRITEVNDREGNAGNDEMKTKHCRYSNNLRFFLRSILHAYTQKKSCPGISCCCSHDQTLARLRISPPPSTRCKRDAFPTESKVNGLASQLTHRGHGNDQKK